MNEIVWGVKKKDYKKNPNKLKFRVIDINTKLDVTSLLQWSINPEGELVYLYQEEFCYYDTYRNTRKSEDFGKTEKVEYKIKDNEIIFFIDFCSGKEYEEIVNKFWYKKEEEKYYIED